MLVSFIIIAYNAEEYLNKSLESLKKQNYSHKEIEVILVDSNSKDNTKKIMKEFQEKNNEDFNTIKVLDNPKKILPAGWNVALKEAQGEVIVRVDAHTFFDENFIENNVYEIEQGESIVGGKCISITENNSKVGKMLQIAEESMFGGGIADFRRENKREYVKTLAFAMYRKKVFDDVGLYNEKLARTEDNEMHYRMKKAGYKFLLSPNIKVYRYARNSLKKLVKQKYLNGKWIGITMKYCPKCFSIYHFIPFAFVLGIIFSVMFALINIPIFLYLLVGVYALFNIINLISIIKKNGFHLEYLCLPVIFFILHVSYGVGTIVGLIRNLFK